MNPVPWTTGLSSDPTVRRLREDASRILSSGGIWAVDAVALELRVAWGEQTPPAEWLAAVLADDPRLWRLPDGRWLHLRAATDGRSFTVRPGPAFGRVGILPADGDLATALVPFASWERIPVTTRHGRGLMERVGVGTDGEAARSLLVCPHALVPADSEALRVIPGPEGLRLEALGQAVDQMADRRYRRAMDRQLRDHTVAPGGPDHSGRVPRPWSMVDAELVVLAVDPTTRRGAVAPLSQALAEGVRAPALTAL
ncbi:MAG TPA: hypothetical protein VMM13_16920 [Euzebya sp.]|nr:hypothetical protein [Euzebya sp.]